MRSFLSRRPAAVLLGLAGAGLGLLSAQGTAASAVPARTALGAASRVSLSGAALAPAFTAALLVAAAASLALAFAGPRLRPVVAGLLVAAGVGAEAAWRIALSGAEGALGALAPAAGQAVRDVRLEPLTLAADVGCLLVIAAGLLGLLLGRAWGAQSSRYDAPGAAPAATVGHGAASSDVRADRASRRGGRAAEDDWDALSRGEDPTA